MFRSSEANSGTIAQKGSKDLAKSSTFVVDQSYLGQAPGSTLHLNAVIGYNTDMDCWIILKEQARVEFF